MALTPVHSTSLPDQVFEQLAGEIVSGGYAEGAALPPERELSAVLGVNRQAVREALKRLEQLGLVRTSHGGAARVLDFHRTAGLDLLAVLAEHADAADALPELLASAMEMRAAIGADVARLCAERASGGVRVELVETAERLAMAGRGQLAALDERFWQCALDGAGNLAYQLAFNSLLRASRALSGISLPWLEEELARSDSRRPIAYAINDGDADAAAAAAREALLPSAQALAVQKPPAAAAEAKG